jgi:hypothetical protein
MRSSLNALLLTLLLLVPSLEWNAPPTGNIKARSLPLSFTGFFYCYHLSEITNWTVVANHDSVYRSANPLRVSASPKTAAMVEGVISHACIARALLETNFSRLQMIRHH